MAARNTVRRPRTNAGTKILDAASTLFVAHGYAATTVEMIAVEAGVAQPTVYFSFHNKMNILRGIYDRMLAPDLDVLAPYRAQLQAALDETDPAMQLAGQVRAAAMLNARNGLLAAMLHRAVDVDSDAAELWQADLDTRRAAHRRLVGALRAGGGLAAGVRPQRAIDVLTTLLGPELYCTFVVERGWSAAEWERWSTAVLRQQLLALPDSR